MSHVDIYVVYKLHVVEHTTTYKLEDAIFHPRMSTDSLGPGCSSMSLSP